MCHFFICLHQVLEQSNELVSGGMGNVCVWCLTHLVCRKRVVDGLGADTVVTQLALVPSRAQCGPRVLAACGGAVVVVDLVEGHVMEYKKSLHLRFGCYQILKFIYNCNPV